MPSAAEILEVLARASDQWWAVAAAWHVAVAVGLAALALGWRPRRRVAGAGLFYGVVGVLWLGVAIDGVLIVGAVMLGAMGPTRRGVGAVVENQPPGG